MFNLFLFVSCSLLIIKNKIFFVKWKRKKKVILIIIILFYFASNYSPQLPWILFLYSILIFAVDIFSIAGFFIYYFF